jgi:AraC-like DNA-binding protein
MPAPALRSIVKTLWVATPATGQPALASAREHVLPTGDMHLVIRLSAAPLRIYAGPADHSGYTVGHAVVGGARAAFYARDVSTPSWSVGAQLHPGAAQALFGASAAELAGRHTPLEDLWGAAAGTTRERLLEAGDPQRQLARFEALLAQRWSRLRGLHPAVAQAIEQLATTGNVGEVVAQSGYSHRHFIALFRQVVGLSPKAYARVRRFQDTLARLTADRTAAWTDLAAEGGYSDQAHLIREFREFAGIAPETYRVISPPLANHVPVGPARPRRA